MTCENLTCEIKDRLAIITFNRPKALNALNAALLEELDAVIDKVNADNTVRVLILTGAGEKAFVAGADISELARCTPLTGKYFSEKGQRIFAKIEQLPIPVMAVVNGYALGGGTEVALACDFIYASEAAMFGLPEITLGLIPGFGGTQRLARLVGVNRAKEMIYTGKMIPARQALELGLANSVFPPEELMEAALKTAGKIARNGATSLQAAKETVNAGLDVDLASGCRIEADAFALCLSSEDAKEGTSAFLEKRKPAFQRNRNHAA